jgi:hypothetical protein
LTITSHGQSRTVTAVELVEEAFREVGFDPSGLAPEFIPFWLGKGKGANEIIAIAGLRPRKVAA